MENVWSPITGRIARLESPTFCPVNDDGLAAEAGLKIIFWGDLSYPNFSKVTHLIHTLWAILKYARPEQFIFLH